MRLLLFLAIVLAAACDRVPLLAPTQSTITITVSSTILPVNGSATVIATVIEQAGTPVQNGTLVTFTGSLGTFDPPEATTVNGQARSTFRARGQSGTARIGAFSGAARAEEVEVRIGGAAAESVTLRAEPATVPVTGGTVQLIAVVSDASGNALPGAPVVFSADQGALGANSVVTDTTGEARTTLTTNRETVARARVGTKEGTVTIRAVTLPGATLTMSPAQPIAGLPVTFTVTPTNVTSGSPIRDVTIDFGDNTPPQSLGAITGAQTVSHVYQQANTYTVTVTVTDIAGQRTTNSSVVTVQRAQVNVAVNAPTSGQVGTPVSISVTVTNTSNIPLQSVTLRFGDGNSTTLPPSGGTVSKTYATAGTYTLVAVATDLNGFQYTGQSQIVIIAGAALEVTLDAQSADPVVILTCVPAMGYPKTCNTNIPIGGFGVRIQFTVGCGAGGLFGGAACPNAIGYRWDYGDGSPPETTTSRVVDHVFSRRDTFVINVQVATSTGATGQQRLTLIVQ